MAGHGHGPSPINSDAAIEKFYYMRENLPNHFKYSKKSGRFVIMALGVVPAVLLWGAYSFGGQLDFAARRRNQSVWRS